MILLTDCLNEETLGNILVTQLMLNNSDQTDTYARLHVDKTVAPSRKRKRKLEDSHLMVIMHSADKQAETRRSDIITAHTHKYVHICLFVHTNAHSCAVNSDTTRASTAVISKLNFI